MKRSRSGCAERTRELRETQQQVLQQERMQALGLMASGVAHDMNNALSVILGFSETVA
jgi:C4-dicarboxylate-specific signal transduction histidine kinase